jgi:hypothetical protein
LRGVGRLRKAGKTHDKLPEQTGLSHTGVSNICSAEARHRRRRVGEKRSLTAPQEQAMRQFMQDKKADPLQLSHAPWTRPAVAPLMEQRIGVNLAGAHLNFPTYGRLNSCARTRA